MLEGAETYRLDLSGELVVMLLIQFNIHVAKKKMIRLQRC